MHWLPAVGRGELVEDKIEVVVVGTITNVVLVVVVGAAGATIGGDAPQAAQVSRGRSTNSLSD